MYNKEVGRDKPKLRHEDHISRPTYSHRIPIMVVVSREDLRNSENTASKIQPMRFQTSIGTVGPETSSVLSIRRE